MATGKPSEYGCKIRALVNPEAVDSIEDTGAYRDIHLKAEFSKYSVLHTGLSVPQLSAALKLNGPA